MEQVFLQKSGVDVRSCTAQSPKLAENAGPPLAHGVRTVATTPSVQANISGMWALNAPPRLDLRITPDPGDELEPPGIGGGGRALSNEQCAGDRDALGIVVFGGVHARYVLVVGAEAHEGRCERACFPTTMG